MKRSCLALLYTGKTIRTTTLHKELSTRVRSLLLK